MLATTTSCPETLLSVMAMLKAVLDADPIVRPQLHKWKMVHTVAFATHRIITAPGTSSADFAVVAFQLLAACLNASTHATSHEDGFALDNAVEMLSLFRTFFLKTIESALAQHGSDVHVARSIVNMCARLVRTLFIESGAATTAGCVKLVPIVCDIVTRHVVDKDVARDGMVFLSTFAAENRENQCQLFHQRVDPLRVLADVLLTHIDDRDVVIPAMKAVKFIVKPDRRLACGHVPELFAAADAAITTWLQSYPLYSEHVRGILRAV